MLSCLLLFCDSVHALFHDFAGNAGSSSDMIEHACGIYKELHIFLEINMELFLCLLFLVFTSP
jgi:hypothetical protein